MTIQPSRRIAHLTRRLAEVVDECSDASRRSVELNAPWLARRTTPAANHPARSRAV